MQTAITHVAIQAATAMMMAIKEADTGPTTGTNMTNVGEMHRPGHERTALRQQTLDWKAPDKYKEALNFYMEVKNILLARAYNLYNEMKFHII